MIDRKVTDEDIIVTLGLLGFLQLVINKVVTFAKIDQLGTIMIASLSSYALVLVYFSFKKKNS